MLVQFNIELAAKIGQIVKLSHDMRNICKKFNSLMNKNTKYTRQMNEFASYSKSRFSRFSM